MKPAEAKRFDALVIGAGAAGLSAAAHLAERGCRVCLLEARERLGGRILTCKKPGFALPLELGAEFVHGLPSVTLTWLARSGSLLVDAPRERWTLYNGTLQPSDDWFEELAQSLRSLGRPQQDLPFAEFLEAHRARLSPRTIDLARRLVEGFDAADASRVSTLAILDEWSGTSAADAPAFRPWGGYGRIVAALAAALDARRVETRLGAVVTEVAWERGRVRARGLRHGGAFELQAPRAVVTLPLGVLQAPADAPGAVRFTPSLREKQTALEHLSPAHALKVLLWFDSAFWEEIDGGRYRDAGFFHAPGTLFPTFWSALPARAPMLTAWCGGSNVPHLANASRDELIGHALEGLAAIFGNRARIGDRLTAAHLHDWRADPFARGAYSYVLAGGAGAREQLAEPLQGTLLFAGEATDAEDAGTVASALQSGQRAAEEALRS